MIVSGKWLFGAWIVGILGVVMGIIDNKNESNFVPNGGLWMAGFFAFTILFSVTAAIIDWKKNG